MTVRHLHVTILEPKEQIPEEVLKLYDIVIRKSSKGKAKVVVNRTNIKIV